MPPRDLFRGGIEEKGAAVELTKPVLPSCPYIPIELLAIARDRAEDDNGRGGKVFGLHQRGGFTQRRFEDRLFRPSRARDNGEAIISIAARGEQFGGNGGEVLDGHIHDDD